MANRALILFLFLSPFALKAQVQDVSVRAKAPLLTYIKFCNYTGGPITKQELLACDSFTLMPAEYPAVKRYYRIKGFSMSIKMHSKENKLLTLKSEGNKLSPDMKVALTSTVAIEDVVIFYDFEISGPNGEIKINGPSFFISK